MLSLNFIKEQNHGSLLRPLPVLKVGRIILCSLGGKPGELWLGVWTVRIADDLLCPLPLGVVCGRSETVENLFCFNVGRICK